MQEMGYEIICEIIKKITKTVVDQKKRQSNLEKAMEGEEAEEVKCLVKELAAQFDKEGKELHSGYNEWELEEIFDRQYEQLYGGNARAEEREKKEAVKQRFILFCREHLNQEAKNTSVGEQMILRKTEALGEDTKKTYMAIKEMQRESAEWFNQLYNDEKTPLLEVDNMGKVRVTPYNAELMVLANSIVLDTTEDRNDYMEVEFGDVCIITLPVRNVGRTPVNYIECRNLSVCFCGESESGSETSAAVLPVITHSNCEGCCMNIAPGSVQKIHFVVTWNLDEESEQDCKRYDWKMRYVEMELAVSGQEKETEYHVFMYWRKIEDGKVPAGEVISLEKKRMFGEYEVEEMWMEKK